MNHRVPFNRSPFFEKQLEYIKDAFRLNRVSGDGHYSHRCEKRLQTYLGDKSILLTPSGSAALELACAAAGLGQDDEVITPSYNFPSSANAALIQKAKPVFADIDPETLNISPREILNKITPKTKALIPIHYGGNSCDMEDLMKIANENDLLVIEDAAQALYSECRGRPLGTWGDMGTFSFHETKNFSCGEGGALVINNDRFTKIAEIIREKGTDRSLFFRGEIDKYTWRETGFSHLLSDILAAVLFAQLENSSQIIQKRKKLFETYTEQLQILEEKGNLKIAKHPDYNRPNYHIFYIILDSLEERTRLMDHLQSHSIQAIFHYIPLHLSPMGKKLGYEEGDFPVSERISHTLLRLPLYYDMRPEDVFHVTHSIRDYYDN